MEHVCFPCVSYAKREENERNTQRVQVRTGIRDVCDVLRKSLNVKCKVVTSERICQSSATECLPKSEREMIQSPWYDLAEEDT